MTIASPVATVLDEDTTCTITLAGDVDALVAPNVIAIGVDAVQSTGQPRVVIDLAGVSFLDSTGIGALITIRNAAEKRDLSLQLRGLSPRLMKLFTITGLHHVFDFA